MSTSPSEHEIQSAYFDWWKRAYNDSPLAWANPNAAKRSFALAAYMKREGLRKRVLDITIAVPRDGMHGMYMELKSKGKRPTSDQMRMIEYLTMTGYYVVWCDNLDAAIESTKLYLGNWRPTLIESEAA